MRTWPVALAIMLVHAGLLVALAALTPWTTDEHNYLAAGMALCGDFDFAPYSTILHGPLPFLGNQLAAGLGFQIEEWADYKFAGRLGTIPWALLAALYLWRFTHEAIGPRAGLVALVLHVLNPVVLAHGCLMTADMPLTTCYVLAVWVMWEWLARARPDRLVLLGAVTGIALATKYLALFLLPALGLAALLETLRGFAPAPWLARGASTLPRRLLELVPAALVVAAVAWLALWSCYAWRPSGYQLRVSEAPANGLDPQAADAGALSTPFRKLAAVPGTAAALQLLPEPWVRGVDYQKFYSEQGGVTFFGDRIGPGFPEYFVVALLTKLPVALLLAIALGLAARAPPWPRRLPILLACAIGVPLAYLSFGTNLQIGVRYLLPVLPLLCLVAARPAEAWLATTRGRLVAGMGLALLLAELARDWPRYVGSFNMLARERPYLLFTDSNLDWPLAPLPGPDGAALAERHPESIELSEHSGPMLGRLRIHGVHLRTPDPRSGGTRIRHWLRGFRPQDRVGAHFAFDVTEDAWRIVAADGRDDARERVDLALALVGAGRAADALEVLDGNADAGAPRVRELARAQLEGRTGEPAYAAGLLEAGRGDVVLQLGDGVAPIVRAAARIQLRQPHAAAGLLEDIARTRPLALDEALVLAAAWQAANDPDRAIATVRAHMPPPEHPAHDQWQKLLHRLRQDLEALRLIQKRSERRPASQPDSRPTSGPGSRGK